MLEGNEEAVNELQLRRKTIEWKRSLHSSLARYRSLPPSEAREKAMQRQRQLGNDGLIEWNIK